MNRYYDSEQRFYSGIGFSRKDRSVQRRTSLTDSVVRFLTLLLIRLSSLWKHRDIIATVSGIIFIGAYMFLAFNMGSISGSGDMEDFVAQRAS